MKLIVTGSPGTGKTTIARKLAKKLKCEYVNERELALEEGIGKIDHDSNELVLPLNALKRVVSEKFKKNNVVMEGHVLCEIRVKVDAIVVLRVHPEILESRLEARGYNAEKTQDNVFCEGIEYCTKHALRNYGKKRVIEVQNEKDIKETLNNIILGLKNHEIM